MAIGQNIKTVSKYEFKKFNGYAFSKEYKYETGIEFPDKVDFFTPDSVDIEKAEYEIPRQYVSAMESFLTQNQWKTFDNNINSYSEQEIRLEKRIRESTMNSIRERSKRLSRYDRQYVGYKTTSGDKILFINFIDTRAGRQGRDFKSTIDKELILGFGEWYEKHTFRLSFNLTTNEISVF